MTHGLTWKELLAYTPKQGESCYTKCGGKLVVLHDTDKETIYECDKCHKKVKELEVEKYLEGNSP